MNKISVISLEKRFEKFEKGVKKSALEILKILKKDKIAVEIYLAGDRLMKKLNKEYRGKDKAANVLSFVEPEKFPHPETKEKFLGEIYLNVANESNKSNKTNKTDKIYLLLHAILHLLGYTHKKKSDRMKMEKKENHVYHLLRHRNFAN